MNTYSREIATAIPQIPPLQVLKKAIQMHQFDPVQSRPGKQQAQVMPGHPKAPYHEREHQLNQLVQVLPDIPISTLETLLSHEKGNANAVVNRIMSDSSLGESETATTTVQECCNELNQLNQDDRQNLALQTPLTTPEENRL